MWLVNEFVLTFSAPKKYAKAQSDNSIETYRVYDLQIDTFVKTIFSDSGGLKTQRFYENFESHFSHKTITFIQLARHPQKE